MAQKVYETEPLSCWQKAKELTKSYYVNYLQAKEKGGLRFSGGAVSFVAIPAGLGDDVHGLAVEPYGALVTASGPFGVECLEATERAGFARDMCAYTRNYWGSIILDRYALGGEFPKPDFRWQGHNCCTHAKGDKIASYLEGADVPCYAIDAAVGHYSPRKEHKVRYLVGQMHDGIEWLERVTGREYNDDRLIEAVLNEWRADVLWAEICTLNKIVPADQLEGEVRELCLRIMRNPPLVTWINKRVIRAAMDSTLETTAVLTSNASPILGESEDANEARSALRERRDPNFQGR